MNNHMFSLQKDKPQRRRLGPLKDERGNRRERDNRANGNERFDRSENPQSGDFQSNDGPDGGNCDETMFDTFQWFFKLLVSLFLCRCLRCAWVALERNTDFVLLVLYFSISMCLMCSKLDWVCEITREVWDFYLFG